MVELKARADAGDALAASRLFRDVKTCFRVWNTNQKAIDSMLADMESGKVQGSERALNDVRERVELVQTSASLCAGLDIEQISELVPATLRAAQLGDTEATDCYVAIGVFGMEAMPGLIDHPEWISDYKRSVLPIAEAAISKENWNVVTMLHGAYGREQRNNLLLSQVTGTDSVQAYRYLRLMDLAVPGGNPHWKPSLEELENEIGPSKRSEADAWAQKTYQDYFASSPLGKV